MKSGKRPTIKDIAQALGISTAAVSKALAGKNDISQDLKERVQTWARDNQYVPDLKARSLVTGKSRTLGVFLLNRFGRRVREYFGFHLLDGLLERCREEDFDLVLLQDRDSSGKPLNYVDQARRKDVDALVVFGIDSKDPQCESLASSGIPLASVDTPLGPGVPLISSDQVGGMASIIGHLGDLGHRGLAYLGLRGEGWVARQRLAGVMAGIEKIPGAQVKVWEAVLDVEGGRTAALKALSVDPRPTALVCAADLQAYGALKAARELGISVPMDLSITGFDDIQASEFLDLPLTTVAQDPASLGREAADLVLRLLKGQSAMPIKLIPTNLIIRSSTRSIL